MLEISTKKILEILSKPFKPFYNLKERDRDGCGRRTFLSSDGKSLAKPIGNRHIMGITYEFFSPKIGQGIFNRYKEENIIKSNLSTSDSIFLTKEELIITYKKGGIRLLEHFLEGGSTLFKPFNISRAIGELFAIQEEENFSFSPDIKLKHLIHYKDDVRGIELRIIDLEYSCMRDKKYLENQRKQFLNNLKKRCLGLSKLMRYGFNEGYDSVRGHGLKCLRDIVSEIEKDWHVELNLENCKVHSKSIPLFYFPKARIRYEI